MTPERVRTTVIQSIVAGSVKLFCVSDACFIAGVRLYGLYVLADCCAGEYSDELQFE
jgi:hypothetical protein